MDDEDLRLREAKPWFDPNGFFLAERDGGLAGFHWTKVPAGDGGRRSARSTWSGSTRAAGRRAREGADPGRPCPPAPLGLAEVMLYVDEDNTAAVKMYTALGFERWSTDVMYRRPGD